jgi:dTMP kinase
MLIVFEGPEGAGKTTQVHRLAERLAEMNVPYTRVREPGGTWLGNEIRRLLLDEHREIVPSAEALLFMASRAQLLEREVRPALDRGAIVLADRFFLSTYAYQAAGRGLRMDDVRAANRLAAGGFVPDLTLLLGVPAGDGLRRADARGDRDRIERADDDFHHRVVEAFASFADPAWQRRHPECGPIVALDGRGTVDEVWERVAAALADRWPETFDALRRSHR